MKTQMALDVANRLRAVMAEFGISSQVELADLCGVNNARVNQWMIGNNLPRVPEMLQLCEKTGLTLDWIYGGKIETLPTIDLAIRLTSFTDGTPLRSVEAEPEASPGEPTQASEAALKARRQGRAKRESAS